MNKKPENSGFSPLEAPLSMRFSIRKVESFFFDIWIQHENSTNRVATNVDFSRKRGKTKIFITNVEKTWFSVISMEKSWKFETRVK